MLRALGNLTIRAKVTFAVLVVTLALGIGAGWIIVASVSKPIGAMTAAMERLAAHDLTTEVAGRDRKDEIGTMAAAVQVFKDNMIAAERVAAEQAADNEVRAAPRTASRAIDPCIRKQDRRIGQRARHGSHHDGGDRQRDVGDG